MPLERISLNRKNWKIFPLEIYPIFVNIAIKSKCVLFANPAY